MEKAPGMLASTRRVVGRGLAFLGAGAVASSVALAITRYQALKADRTLPDEFVLEVDLERLELVEALPGGPLAPLALLGGGPERKVELRKVVKALERAGGDDRVRGLLGYVGRREALGGLAMIQELRNAVAGFSAAAAKRAAAGGAAAVSVAFAPSFGEAGSNGTTQYYLASAFDRVVMQPSGLLGLLGLQSQIVFLRDALDKAKVTPIFFTREQYKTAAHVFTQRAYTPQHRENALSIINDLAGQMWAGIAHARALPMAGLLELVASAPVSARIAAGLPPHGSTSHAAASSSSGTRDGTAITGTLLDGLQYKDQVLAAFQKSEKQLEKEIKAAVNKEVKAGKAETMVDPQLPRVPLTKYMLISELKEATESQGTGVGSWLSSSPWRGLLPSAWLDGSSSSSSDKADGTSGGTVDGLAGTLTAESAGWVPKPLGQGKPKVAVVHAVGAIVQGPVLPGPQPPNTQVIDASRLAAELERLGEASDVAAVVLRVSSPGGSALGSDTIHRALVRLRDRGKKVVVSCGDVAASGGMFIAVASDKIFAQPGTVTGSIGVVTGKFNVRGLLEDYGIKPASLEAGSRNLDLLSPFKDMDDKQVTVINTLMDDIYLDFIRKVASGRRMSIEAVRALAGGRVYTGKQARDNGLVDELGGLKDAVAAAKQLAGLPAEEEKVVVFDYPPRRPNMLLRLLRAASGPGGGPDSNPADAPKPSVGVELGAGLMGSPGVGAVLASLLLGPEAAGALTSSTATGSAALSGAAGASGLLGAVAACSVGMGSGGASAKQLSEAAAAVLATAILMDGQVATYSPDGDMLARSLS